MPATTLPILALSGSLRAASINSAFCRAAARLAPTSLTVRVFDGLSVLPLFNPDLESDPPQAVCKLRAAVHGSRALLIASPEYAHGVSGAMKNALDWLVGYEEFAGMPIALFNTSPRAHHAAESLREILQTMAARIVPEASMTLPLLGSLVTEDAILAAPEITARIRASLAALARTLTSTDSPGPSFPIAGE